MQVSRRRAVLRPTHVPSATMRVVIASGTRVDEQIASKPLTGGFRFARYLLAARPLHQKSGCPAISLRPSSPGVNATLSILRTIPIGIQAVLLGTSTGYYPVFLPFRQRRCIC